MSSHSIHRSLEKLLSIFSGKDTYFEDDIRKTLKNDFYYDNDDTIEKLISDVKQSDDITMELYHQYLQMCIDMKFENMDVNTSYEQLFKFYDKICTTAVEHGPTVFVHHDPTINELLLSCYMNNMSLVELTLPNAQQKEINDAVCMALLMKHYNLVRYMLENTKCTCLRQLLHLLTLLNDKSDNLTNLFIYIIDLDVFKKVTKQSPEFVILNDTLGYALQHGKIQIAEYLLKRFDLLDPYATFDGETFTFFEIAFSEKNLKSMEWILEKYPDALVTFDIEDVFYNYKYKNCIPALDFLLKRYPSLNRKTEIILQNAITNDEVELIDYIFETVPNMNLTSSVITKGFHNMRPETADLVLSKTSVEIFDNEHIIGMTACMYSHNNFVLLKHFQKKYPSLLKYNEDKVVALYKICISKDALEAADILVVEKDIDPTTVLVDILTDSSFTFDKNRYNLHYDFYLNFKNDIDEKKVISHLVKLSKLVNNMKLFNQILTTSTKLTWDIMEHFIDTFEMDTEVKRVTLEEIYNQYYLKITGYVSRDTIKTMVRLVQKYHLKLHEDVIKKYMKEVQYRPDDCNLLRTLLPVPSSDKMETNDKK